MSFKIFGHEFGKVDVKATQQAGQTNATNPIETSAVEPEVFAQSVSSKVDGVNFSSQSKTSPVTKTEDQAKVIKSLTESYKKLEEEYNNSKTHKGAIGTVWDGFKNLVGMKTGSKKTDTELAELKKDIDELKNNPEKTTEIYEKVTGKKLTNEALDKMEKGEDALTNSKKAEAVRKYTESQDNARGLVCDMASGITAGLVYTAAVAAAPFTGGASIAVGVVAASAAGSLVKTGVHALDKLSAGEKYTLKDAKYDMATGALNGVLAPITAGIGGAVAKGVGGIFVKEGVEEIGTQIAKEATKGMLKETAREVFAKEGIKGLGKEFVKDFGKEMAKNFVVGGAEEAVAQGTKQTFGNFFKESGKKVLVSTAQNAAEGSVWGSIGNTADYLLITDKDQLTFEGAATAFGQGAVGGFIAGGILGGANEVAGVGFGSVSNKFKDAKVVTKVSSKLNPSVVSTVATGANWVALGQLTKELPKGFKRSFAKDSTVQ